MKKGSWRRCRDHRVRKTFCGVGGRPAGPGGPGGPGGPSAHFPQIFSDLFVDLFGVGAWTVTDSLIIWIISSWRVQQRITCWSCYVYSTAICYSFLEGCFFGEFSRMLTPYNFDHGRSKWRHVWMDLYPISLDIGRSRSPGLRVALKCPIVLSPFRVVSQAACRLQASRPGLNTRQQFRSGSAPGTIKSVYSCGIHVDTFNLCLIELRWFCDRSSFSML